MSYTSKVRAKFRRKVEEAEEEAEEGGEINLVPYLDIVTNVLIFLLATSMAVQAMANINVTSPSYSEASASADTPDEPPKEKKPQLNLTVSVSGTGFIIAGSGGVMYENNVPGKLPTIPKKGGKYDFKGLVGLLSKVKENFKDENRAILSANPDIPYHIVVATMDTLREKPGKQCTQECKDKSTASQACAPDQLAYTGDCLFPEVLLGAGVQ